MFYLTEERTDESILIGGTDKKIIHKNFVIDDQSLISENENGEQDLKQTLKVNTV